MKKRIPLAQRILPTYTNGEEAMNMITHIVGGGIAVVVLVACVVLSSIHGSVWGVVSSSVYGFSMIALYCMSSVYHGLRPSTSKKVMQVIDHCTIYMLIAGTYTPITLVALRPEHPAVAWTIFGVEWALALAAATLTAIDLKKYTALSMTCYIIMGWLVIGFVGPVIDTIGNGGFAWLLAGGISYTVGAALYGVGKKLKYFHSVFHIFVVIGSLLHAVCIVFYIV